MKAEVEIETEKPGKLRKVIEPSLKTDERVNYSIKSTNQELAVQTETETLGVLRGCSDTAFRLTMLAEKLYYR